MLHLEEGEVIPTDKGFCLRPVLGAAGRHVKEAVLLYHVPCGTCGSPVVVRLAQRREPHWRKPDVNAARRYAACRGAK